MEAARLLKQAVAQDHVNEQVPSRMVEIEHEGDHAAHTIIGFWSFKSFHSEDLPLEQIPTAGDTMLTVGDDPGLTRLTIGWCERRVDDGIQFPIRSAHPDG